MVALIARLAAVLLCAIAVGDPGPAAAQALDADGERFKAEVVATYGEPTIDRVRALLHPKSAACLRANAEYERYVMRAETRQPAPMTVQVSVDEVAADADLPYRDFEFPVRPTHIVRMEYGQIGTRDARSGLSRVAEKYIARDGARWYLILPCATPEGMRRLRDMGLLDGK